MSDAAPVLDFKSEDDFLLELSKTISADEVSLDQAWEAFGFGDKISIKYSRKGEPLKSAYLSLSELKHFIKLNRTTYWSPHTFTNPYKTTIENLDYYRAIGMDVDSKLDIYFWTKTNSTFKIWGDGEMYEGIPCPSIYNFSGWGYHPYWLLIEEKMDKKMKELVNFIVKLYQFKLSRIYENRLDRINRIQIFRVPESKTKTGGVCRSFLVNGYKRYKLLDLIKFAVTEEEYQVVLAYLAGDLDVADVYDILARYSREYFGEDIVVKRKVEFKIEDVKADLQNIDVFNPKTLGKFYHIVSNDNSIIKKDFVYRCLNIIRMQAPIYEGTRDLRLFGMCVALGKCGASRESVIKIAHLINDIFFDKPLSPVEVYNCYCNYDRYIRMREFRLREYFGIKKWYIYTKHPSTMTRKEAAKNASEISNKRTKKKVRIGFSELGFDMPIKRFCIAAEVSRQTYYRYINDGTLQLIINWFINVCNYQTIKNNDLTKFFRKCISGIGKFSSEQLVNLSDQYFLAVQSRSLAATP
jgi:hypothetical protein